MAHLKKSATTGHLLKNSAGHLVKGCGNCTLCDVPDLICTLVGLTTGHYGDDISGANGVWTVPWDNNFSSACEYKINPFISTVRGSYWLAITVAYASSAFQVTIVKNSAPFDGLSNWSASMTLEGSEFCEDSSFSPTTAVGLTGTAVVTK